MKKFYFIVEKKIVKNKLIISFKNVNKEIDEFFKESLTGLSLFSSSDFKHSIFFIKDNEILFELCESPKDKDDRYLWVKETGFWCLLMKKFNLTSIEVQEIIKEYTENILKLGKITPVIAFDDSYANYMWKNVL